MNAGNIRVEHFVSTDACNQWLLENSEIEIFDIKFSSSDSDLDILIIYRLD